MKRYKKLIQMLLLVVSSCSLAYGQTDTLTVIHVNDTHSNLLPFGGGDHGGFARVASQIGYWRMTEPNSIVVHTGDFMVGTLMFNTYFGVPELQLLDGLGFDALVLGNHEFDVGPDQLGGILAMAELSPNFSILAANLDNLGEAPVLESFVQPYVLKERGDLKVGLIGLTTPAANVESRPSPVVISEAIIESTVSAVAELNALGADVILVLSHLGLDLDTQIAASGYLQGVNAIVGGHSHASLAEPLVVGGIPIVHAGSFYNEVGKLRLLITDGVVSVLDDQVVEITDAIPEEPTTAALLTQLQAGIIQKYAPIIGDPFKPIGWAWGDLYAKPLGDGLEGNLDTPLGNLLTTALFESGLVVDIDMALEPAGHIAADIPERGFTAAELFRTFPYGYDETDGLGFRVATYQLYGAEIWAILENLMTFVNPTQGHWDYLIQATGLEYGVLWSPDYLELSDVKVGGAELEPYRLYTVVSSDQVVGYLQGLFGINPANLVVHPVSVFDVMYHYVDSNKVFEPISDGHLKVAGITSTERPGEIVSAFRLEQNYPNPFNPSTVIPFRTEQPGLVTLNVFDVLGRQVRSLVTAELPSGAHEYVWDARSEFGEAVPSGVYLYRLTIQGRTATRAMLLVR